VWFGEILPFDALAAAEQAARDCDLLLSVGTSNLVYPAAGLPWIAAARGADVVVVNTTPEGQRQGPSIHHVIGPAGVILPALVAAAWPEAV
jgi:NAD-dependent deacetylase